MIINVTMKTPDAMEDAARLAVRNEIINEKENATEDQYEEIEETFEERVNEQMRALRKWFRYGEYLDIRFDTEKMEAVVRKVTD